MPHRHRRGHVSNDLATVESDPDTQPITGYLDRVKADVAVVIATRNRADKIATSLGSVLACDRANIEVVVVDQSDGDDTERAIEPFRSDPRFTFVRSELRGLSRARNTGFIHTTAPLVAITDDDCIVPTDWTEKITQPFGSDPHVGIVFGTVVPLEPDRPGWTPSISFDEPRTLTSANEAWWFSRSGMCLGANMAVRRSTYDELRGFDDHMGAGSHFSSAEDNDLSWRSLLAGWHTHITNVVEVVHDGHRDADDVRRLVTRDFFGMGGGLAKYVRTMHPGAFLFVAMSIFRFGIAGPLEQLLGGKRPRGFRRPYMLLRGLYAGLRAPMNKDYLQFEPLERVLVPA